MKQISTSSSLAARQLLWCALLAEECARWGVQHVFICPGSRSAPLATAFAAHPALRCHVHFDERGAAFAALGVARSSLRPAAVITTSGTAVANLLPAVLEAYEDAVPLLLLTADRPPELRNCGANQTCQQNTLLVSHCRFFFDVPPHNSVCAPAVLLSTLDEALAKSLHPLAGPVQLNLQMREPLLAANMDPAYPLALPQLGKFFTAEELAPLRQWLRTKECYLPLAPAVSDAQQVLQHIRHFQPQLLLCGSLRSAPQQQAVLALSHALGVSCFADICSGLRGQSTNVFAAHAVLQSAPSKGNPTEKNKPPPPAQLRVLRVGGRFIHPQVEIWCAAQLTLQLTDGRRIHPTHAPRRILVASIETLLKELPPPSLEPSPSTATTTVPTAHLQTAAAAAVPQPHSTDAAKVAAVETYAPYGSALFLGNSLSVRLFDQHWRGRPDITAIAANRGVSGIDGNIATAVGCALGWQRPTIAVVGDQTALHDLNSLALLHLLNEQTTPFTLILLNNGGGRIFEQLGHTACTRHPEAFLGVQLKDFSAAARLWDLPYRRAHNVQELARLLKKPHHHRLLEVTF